jgi:hypothetical protein
MSANFRFADEPGRSRARIDVDKSASHHLSQTEILASDNPCSQRLCALSLDFLPGADIALHGCKIFPSSPWFFDTSTQEIGNGQKEFGPI